MSQNLNLPKPKFQSQLRSRPVREALEQIESNFNLLRTEVYASLASTITEVTVARDNISTLVGNMNIRKVYGNGFVGEDYVVQNPAGADMKVRCLPGSGIVAGVGVDWRVQLSDTIIAPAAGKHRIDIVAVNTDNSLSIIGGGATATSNNCALPSIASTQEQLAFLYLTAGTTALSDNVNIFNVKPYSAKYPDVAITAPSDSGIGLYDVNNLVITATLSVSLTCATFENLVSPSALIIRTKGNANVGISVGGGFKGGVVCTQSGIKTSGIFYSGSNNGIDALGDGTLAGDGGASGIKDTIFSAITGSQGGNGSDGLSNGGAGGGGGGSIFSAGGDGGAGGDENASGDNTLGGKAKIGTPSFILLSSGNVVLNGLVSAVGGNGADGADSPASGIGNFYGGGGAGGGSGGNVVVCSKGYVKFYGGITASGGDGGDGGDATGVHTGHSGGGGGGGAGAGGLIWIRGVSYASSFNIVQADAGTAGSGGLASGGDTGGNNAGSAGGAAGAGLLVYGAIDSDNGELYFQNQLIPAFVGIDFLE
jgi:hypothetical protein